MTLALEGGALILKQRMQQLAPIWTGRMQRSVHIGDVTRRADGFAITVGPTVSYAKYTELEPWIIGKRPGPKSQIKGATIPWMRPAADDVREDVQGHIEGSIRQMIRALSRRRRR